jgi:hypothetical protein
MYVNVLESCCWIHFCTKWVRMKSRYGKRKMSREINFLHHGVFFTAIAAMAIPSFHFIPQFSNYPGVVLWIPCLYLHHHSNLFWYVHVPPLYNFLALHYSAVDVHVHIILSFLYFSCNFHFGLNNNSQIFSAKIYQHVSKRKSLQTHEPYI